jgi:hypothetical protein
MTMPRPGARRWPAVLEKPPTLILAVDQVEELFQAEAQVEAMRFLSLTRERLRYIASSMRPRAISSPRTSASIHCRAHLQVAKSIAFRCMDLPTICRHSPE